MTVIYGSSIADGTLTNACAMAATTGGTETSKLTTNQAVAGTFGEVYSQGGTSTTYSAIQAPSGHGWVFLPGAGTFATGNWSASITLSSANGTVGMIYIVRFYKYTGSYVSIGSINGPGATTTAKTTYSFTATSMSTVTFAATDLLYVDLWLNDTSGVSSDNPTVYISNSATQGVANDMQITTSTFTASATRKIISDGMGGMFS